MMEMVIVRTKESLAEDKTTSGGPKGIHERNTQGDHGYQDDQCGMALDGPHHVQGGQHVSQEVAAAIPQEYGSGVKIVS